MKRMHTPLPRQLQQPDSEEFKNRELHALYRMAILMNSSERVEDVYPAIADEMTHVTGFQFAGILLYDTERKVYRVATLQGATPGQNDWVGREFPADVAVFGKAFLDDAFVASHDDLSKIDKPSDFVKANNLRSYIAVPIRTRFGLKGSLCIADPTPGICSAEIIEWMQTLATHLASALERRELSEQYTSQKAAAMTQTRMSELGRMAGGIAHEINTPLATIQLLADHLKEIAETHGHTDYIDSLNRISTTVTRLGTIVKGLRAFSREGSQDPFREANLKSILDDTLTLCAERFRFNQIDIRLDLKGELRLKCRDIQISQLLINLLNNAFDAIQNLEERWIIIGAREIGDWIEISVTDSVAGLPKEVRDKIGTPFFTTKETGVGTGLGLSISMGIVHGHHGMFKLDAKSLNTKFIITLPKDPEQKPQAKAA